MGVYRYDDPQTGQGYDLNIVGDTPTNEEFARLAAVLQQDRADFGVRFERWFSENSIADEIEPVLAELDAKGYLYEKDGNVKYKSFIKAIFWIFKNR